MEPIFVWRKKKIEKKNYFTHKIKAQKKRKKNQTLIASRFQPGASRRSLFSTTSTLSINFAKCSLWTSITSGRDLRRETNESETP